MSDWSDELIANPETMTPPMTDPPDPPDSDVDAGAASCGDFLLVMWLYFRKQPPGSLVRVRATGDEAGREIAAWCRLTGNILVDERPPHYWIRVKPP